MQKIGEVMKRRQVWGFFLSMAVMAIISLAFFYPDNFEGNSLMQSDMQQGEANGHEGAEYYESTGDKALWTNSLFSGMPTFQISPSYPSNSLFNWLNTVYGLGLPSPSNLLFMMMFGFFIFMYCMRMRWYYALIGSVAWGLSSYFVIIIGAGHIWKFVALTYIPPTIGGLVLCYRGRYWLGGGLTALFAMLQLNANHPQMTYYFAFVMVGFVIAFLVEAIKERKVKQWVVASCVLMGAGALSVGANLPSLYNTYEYSKETKRSQSELTSAVDAATPSAEKPTGGLPKSEIVNWSYGRSEMVSLLVPNIKGGASAKPEKGQMHAMSMDKLSAASEVPVDVQPLLPFFSQYFNDSEGTNGPVYVGALICFLFLLGCFIVRGPVKWALLVLTIISVFLALGRNCEWLTDLMIYHFPMYNKFRAVESILVVAEFTMPVLAILALCQFIDDVRSVNNELRSSTLTFTKVSFGVCVFICLLCLLVPQIFGQSITSQDMGMLANIQEAYPNAGINSQNVLHHLANMRYSMVRADAWRSLLFLIGGFLLLYLYSRRTIPMGWTLAGVGCLVLCDLYTVDKRYVDHESFAPANSFANRYDPFAPDAIDEAILVDKGLSYRVFDKVGFWDAHRSYHHKMIGGYHAAKLNRYEDLIQRRMQHVLGIGYIPELRDDSIVALYSPEEQATIRELQADYRVLDMLNARYIITGDKQQPLLVNPDALGNAWMVERISYVDNANEEMASLSTLNPAKEAVANKKYADVLGEGCSVLPTDDITLTSYTPNRLQYKVDTTNGGIAVFSEVYFPWGWKATIDGEAAPLARVNYVLRALRVPAGSHDIVMTFDPDSLHATGTVAYASVTLIYLWVLGGILFAYMRREDEEKKTVKKQ